MHSLRFINKQPKVILSKNLTSLTGILCDKDDKKRPHEKKSEQPVKLGDKIVEGVQNVTEKLVHKVEKAAETIHEMGQKKDKTSDELKKNKK